MLKRHPRSAYVLGPTFFQAICDHCFTWLPWQKYDDLEAELRKAGWYSIGMTPGGNGAAHVCNRCAKKPLAALK